MKRTKAKIPKPDSPGEAAMAMHLKSYKIGFRREVHFALPRKWRFDFAIDNTKIAIEVNGGHWIKGRHGYGDGYARDLDKKNAATSLGWSVYEFTTEQVLSGFAIKTILDALGMKP